LAGYVCDRNGCYRCYHEASGLLRFRGGQADSRRYANPLRRIGEDGQNEPSEPADLAGTVLVEVRVKFVVSRQQKRTMRESEVHPLQFRLDQSFACLAGDLVFQRSLNITTNILSPRVIVRGRVSCGHSWLGKTYHMTSTKIAPAAAAEVDVGKEKDAMSRLM